LTETTARLHEQRWKCLEDLMDVERTTTLVTELGVEPGTWLQNIHRSILRDADPDPDRLPSGVGPVAAGRHAQRSATAAVTVAAGGSAEPARRCLLARDVPISPAGPGRWRRCGRCR
jgi:hypothetical protein